MLKLTKYRIEVQGKIQESPPNFSSRYNLGLGRNPNL